MVFPTNFVNRLPQLPGTQAPRLSSSILAGLNTGVRDPRAMIDTVRNSDRGIFDPSYIAVLDPDYDFATRGNATRRRLITFDPAREGFRRSVNSALGGGESSPVLITALGIATGAVMAPAGIAFSIFSTAIEMQRVNQPVRVRQGDAIDKIEVIGKRDNKVFHWETYVLVDPFRVRANYTPMQWVIHGHLSEVSID